MLSLLESWAPASSLTTFKLAQKTATLLALVTVKHCSHLTLLCIDNQHLSLQHNAAIFIPMSGGKIIWVICPLRFVLSLTPMLIFALYFYLKAFLRCTEPFRMKPDGSCVTSLFLSNNRQPWPDCAKTISSWVRKVLGVAKAHMSPSSLGGYCFYSLSSWCFPGDHPAGR